MGRMKKFVCIHGHFYQPPRENPWTGEVDEEPSAAPFHDWNERIAKECYEANTHAAILDAHGQVKRHINNFSYLSYDIGPTLLSWLHRKAPEVYKAILDADRESVLQKNGHGNAMAQVYDHIIMPLAKKRDKITQVIWGIRDFEFHYKRKPEGMWLSETAVDRESLGILADNGILFTVLAPHQCARVRHIGFGSRWRETVGETVDPKHAYRLILDYGKQFHVFFYDAPVSRTIAFEGILSNGDNLVNRILSAYGHREREQLVSSATDGESFGHHHRFGEMAVAYAFNKIHEQKLATITNYADFLDQAGSYWQADIRENTSWSCAHGVERWRSDCGCRMNSTPGWNQKWRQFLREAFEFLQSAVDEIFESETGRFLKDPWRARNDYISVILKDTKTERQEFISRNARRTLNEEEKRKLWDLLEAEKFSLFMYTSCGWFFDELSGLEPVQMMKFAARAMELAEPHRTASRAPLEESFLKILSGAQSNIPEHGNGADVFIKFAKPWGQTPPGG